MVSDALRLDRRLTPARPDLAAASLRGQVEAERFVEGERFTVLVETVDVRRQPRPDALLETQLLYGETVVVYEDEEGWGWAQADGDKYVGYVAMNALGRSTVTPTHRAVVNRTFVYPAADMKQPFFACVPRGGLVEVEGTRNSFSRIRGHGFVYSEHLAPIDCFAADYVEIATQFLGTPYLWGGKSGLGIDCSGLVQVALSAAGVELPRDTDMQERYGQALPFDDNLVGLVRGDLVFWKGHVGIMLDSDRLLHANAHHMLVTQESLRSACNRIFGVTGLPIASIRRLGPM